MSSGRAIAGAVFVAGVGLLTLALNAIAVPKSPTFQTIGACLLLAGILAALLLTRRQDS
jgi:divalent metal cation (Fe/Co/Zn/Cd) transporter